MTSDNLCEYILLAKEKCSSKTLLNFYLDRLNTIGGVVKYFDGINDFERCANELLDYNNYYRPSKVKVIKKQNSDKIDDYIKHI